MGALAVLLDEGDAEVAGAAARALGEIDGAEGLLLRSLRSRQTEAVLPSSTFSVRRPPSRPFRSLRARTGRDAAHPHSVKLPVTQSGASRPRSRRWRGQLAIAEAPDPEGALSLADDGDPKGQMALTDEPVVRLL